MAIDGAAAPDVRPRLNAVLAESPPHITAGPAPKLTKREREVLRLVAIGQSNQAIADALGVSAETIKRHVRNLLIKTALHNRTELAHDARERALDT